MQDITARHDASWRGSTHHLIFSLGDCYIDVRVQETGAVTLNLVLTSI